MHLERHRAIGMARCDRMWLRPKDFANGIAICVPKCPHRQFSARRRSERCSLEWLQMKLVIIQLFNVETAKINSFTSNSGWNYCWFGCFDQHTFTDWQQSGRRPRAEVRFQYDVRCWNGSRPNERCVEEVRGIVWGRKVWVITAGSDNGWFWFDGSHKWRTDNGAGNVFTRTNISEIVVRWRLHR